MKKLIISLLVIVNGVLCYSQSTNLVPNPSFEDYTNCPNSYGYLEKALHWFDGCATLSSYYNCCANNTFPHIGVPYNGGCNYLIPKSGNAYAGIFAELSPDNRRAYLEVRLTEPLKANTGYHAGFWICMYDCLYLAMDMAGMYFSVDSVWCPQNQIPPVNLINAVPQVNNTPGNVLTDTANWTLISGYFKADGGEQFLVIGNFYPWNQTTWYWTQMQGYPRAYYFIDDVFVYEDSLTTGAPQNITQPDPGINIIPNPANSTITIEIPDARNEYYLIKFLTETGKLISSSEQVAVNGLVLMNVDKLRSGFYLIHIQTDRIVKYTGKLVIIK